MSGIYLGAEAEEVPAFVPLFNLGVRHHEAGRFDEAFAAWQAGNRARRDAYPETDGRIAADARLAEAIEQGYDAAFFESIPPGPDLLQRPIFVVGMPRSGSTLIEQILDCHPRVQAMGEANPLPDWLPGVPPVAPGPAHPSSFRQLAPRYLAHMRGRGLTGAAAFVDKELCAFRWIGALTRIFGNAVILHVYRGPLDTCFSCFRMAFRDGAYDDFDLGDIGRAYVRYRRLMEHWDSVLPGRVISVDHEALVADPEPHIRRLVTEACGLAWDDACLRPWENPRDPRTASSNQVRRPFFSSAGLWRPYARHLAPLIEVLGPYAHPAAA